MQSKMNYGICLLSLIPQRSEPSEKSEMINQLLFGDLFNIMEHKDNWMKICTEYDGYEGWIDKKMATLIEVEYYNKLKQQRPVVTSNLIKIHNITKNRSFLLTPGASLYNVKGNTFNIHNSEFEIPRQSESATNIEPLTAQFINAPYLWGGKSLLGIDCSGFVQVIFKILGIQLPRDASEQSKIGETIGFVQEAKTGDLAFFDNPEGRITHVGILLNNNTIIHASGCVRIDKIDSHGIFNKDRNVYSHKLRIIKRTGNNNLTS